MNYMDKILEKIKISKYNKMHDSSVNNTNMEQVKTFINVRTEEMDREDILEELAYYVYMSWENNDKQMKDDLEYIDAINKEKSNNE
tara:strand:+ start:604 stop:861 length:258 start_codon:yes stop_codon:yes gene_type:complete